MAGHIATAKRTDWCTPPEIVGAVHGCFGGPPGLDPCSNEASIVGAKREYRPPEHDGLVEPWDAQTIYCNPPFGRGLASWVTACAATNFKRGSRVILLLPAAVDTSHWHNIIFPTAHAICFLRGRLRFIGAPASAPMAMAVVYWGGRYNAFADAFARLGHCTENRTDIRRAVENPNGGRVDDR